MFSWMLPAGSRAETGTICGRQSATCCAWTRIFPNFTRCVRPAAVFGKSAPAGIGRLLRSPTVFEDLVKVICTTNVQWGGTKRMVRELVDAFGLPFDK